MLSETIPLSTYVSDKVSDVGYNEKVKVSDVEYNEKVKVSDVGYNEKVSETISLSTYVSDKDVDININQKGEVVDKTSRFRPTFQTPCIYNPMAINTLQRRLRELVHRQKLSFFQHADRSLPARTAMPWRSRHVPLVRSYPLHCR